MRPPRVSLMILALSTPLMASELDYRTDYERYEDDRRMDQIQYEEERRFNLEQTDRQQRDYRERSDRARDEGERYWE